MRKRKIILIVSIIIIIFIILFSFILIEINRYSSSEKLQISLKPSKNDVDYYVNIPILIDNSNIANIISKLSIKHGNGNYKIVNSEYGRVLNITSSGELILESIISFRTHDIEQSELWWFSEWSTKTRLSNKTDVLNVRGGTEGRYTNMKLDIEISYIADSNEGTSYFGEREDKYWGKIQMDNEWTDLYGYEEMVAA